jgi:hypothetical protein
MNPFKYTEGDYIPDAVDKKSRELNPLHEPLRQIEKMKEHLSKNLSEKDAEASKRMIASLEAVEAELNTIKARIYSEAEEIVENLKATRKEREM